MSIRPPKANGKFFADDPSILRAMRAAVRAALLEHKLAGRSIAVEQDGKVVILPPEEIPVRIPQRIRRMVRMAGR